ncbi:MAG: hypothetical protein SGI83_08585 [Bacteroidota bacterium]|nr:hypothetical protein [Bacteroidota bacterium]
MNTAIKKPISKQELKILQLVAMGYTSEKIGAELVLQKLRYKPIAVICCEKPASTIHSNSWDGDICQNYCVKISY